MQRLRLERVHRLLARLLGTLAPACGVDSEVASIKSRDPSLNVVIPTCNQVKDPVDTPSLNSAFLHLKGDHRNNNVVDSIHQDSLLRINGVRDNIHQEGILLSSRVSSSSSVAVLLLRGTCHDLDFLHLIHMWEVGQIQMLVSSRVRRRCKVNGDNHSRGRWDPVEGHPCSNRGRDSSRGRWDPVEGHRCSNRGKDSSRGRWDQVVGLLCSSIQVNRGRGRDFLQMVIQDSIHLVDKGPHSSSNSSDRGRKVQQTTLPGINKAG